MSSPATAATIPETRKLRLGGAIHWVRTLGPADAVNLMAFFASHTSETIQSRYGYQIRSMSEQRAEALVAVDEHWDLALGIFESDDKTLEAVGRFCREPSGRKAEFALVVREDRRHLGMGSLLLRALVRAGEERGLDCLWGQIRADNLDMIDLAHHLGFAIHGDADRSVRAVYTFGQMARPREME